ncbi:MAG: HD domain-containing protein [Thermoplasmatales archaeon]|nr:HD domain-containing protein [Thermoplasmatales archaeon]
MTGKDRVIHDPLHGGIRTDGVFMELLDRPEMQRLRSVRQLGLGNLVFPGANHTRFEHSLGVYHLAGRMASSLQMNADETRTVRAAALLHDICHPPFSHTLEEILGNVTGLDHMDLARKLIHGEIPYMPESDRDLFGGMEPLSKLLEDAGIDPGAVCDLIEYPRSRSGGLDLFMSDGSPQSFFENKDYIHQIIHGPVDADQMDYLLRDAHYTGVVLGTIDIDRLLSQIRIDNGRMVVGKGGIAAAEGLMVSRALMYSSVYYHKTVRIAEMMLTKAAEISGADLSELYLMSDCTFINHIVGTGGRASELARKVMSRRLYKNAYVLQNASMSDDAKADLSRYAGYADRKSLEAEIALEAGLEDHEVVIDIPSKSILLSKVKIGKTDVYISDDEGRMKPIFRISPLAKALQSREIFDWAITVSSPQEHTGKVAAACRRVLSFDDAEGP